MKTHLCPTVPGLYHHLLRRKHRRCLEMTRLLIAEERRNRGITK